MKKFFIILFVIICILGFSVVPLAATPYNPNSLSFIHEENNYYVLNVDIKTSEFTNEQLSIWKNFMDAFTGKSTNKAFIVYNSFQKQFLCYCFSDVLGFSSSLSSANGAYFTYAKLNLVSEICFDLSGACIQFKDYSPSKLTSVLLSTTQGFYLFYGYDELFYGTSSLSGYSSAVSRLCYFDLAGKNLEINGVLGDSNIQHNLTINYQYSDGTQAFETYISAFSEGDSFSIPSPSLGGFKPSINTISGQMGNTDLSYTVTYTPINHSVTVHYQYENGSQALEPYSGTFLEGQPYSIPTPAIKGYTSSLNIISGEMGTSDLSYTIIFTKVKEPDSPPSSSGNSSSESSDSSSSANGGYVVWNPSWQISSENAKKNKKNEFFINNK